ncbi:hypothetical protein MRB53_028301 [Persea americana]|uniref:Uncharacterized protein n=1 Tax=Persea americana TaxID=3435 RepID=A0ACC2KFL5_PERAE|nr:hypothetical protein MRB53_028301 [Persea americana]
MNERGDLESYPTLFRMHLNSLDLSSLRWDFWSQSIKSLPLRSTISSLISSVVLALISISSSLFAIIFTEEEGFLPRDDDGGVWIQIPWKDFFGGGTV